MTWPPHSDKSTALMDADTLGRSGIDRYTKAIGRLQLPATRVLLSTMKSIYTRRTANELDTIHICHPSIGTSIAPIRMAELSRKCGIKASIHVVEPAAHLAETLRVQCAKHPEIMVIHADPRRLLASAASVGIAARSSKIAVPAPVRPYDVVAGLLISQRDAATDWAHILRLFHGAAREEWLLVEVERGLASWIRMMLRAGAGKRAFASQFVRRGYTKDEWRRCIPVSNQGKTSIRSVGGGVLLLSGKTKRVDQS